MGIQAPWVGKTPEEYFGYTEEFDNEYYLEREEDREREYE